MAKSLLDPTGPYGQPSVVKPPRQGIGSNIGAVPGYTAPKTTPSGITGPVGGATTTPAGAGGTTTTYSPMQVYQSDILNDPGSVAAQGIFDAQTGNLAAARADAIQRAVVNAGWSPSMSGSLSGYSGDVTQGTLAAAAANPMSQKAQLDLQLNQANQNMPYDLAASGAGRSGAGAIQQGNLQRQYQTATYQGQQDLLNNIYGAGSNYAQNYNSAVQQLEYARQMVAQRLQQSAGYSQSIDPNDPGFQPVGVNSGSAAPAAPYAYPADYPTYQPSQTTQAVQRVIASLGVQPGQKTAPNLYQNIRNIRMG